MWYGEDTYFVLRSQYVEYYNCNDLGEMSGMLRESLHNLRKLLTSELPESPLQLA
jgi:hypothetical protein